jgi:hypothetical protein
MFLSYGSRPLSRWALALSHVSWLWPLPSREESSDAATCSSAPELASLPRWAPMLPHGPGLASPRGELLRCHVFSMWAPVLPCGTGLASSRGELRCFRVFLTSGPRLPTEVGSDAATCHMTPSSASPRGEHQCCHVPHGPQRAVDHMNKERFSCRCALKRRKYRTG